MSDYPKETYLKADSILCHHDKNSHKDKIILARELHRWALEYAGKQSPWISVEDRLPEVNEWVLVYAPIHEVAKLHNSVYMGAFIDAEKIGFGIYNGGSLTLNVATHWMPLPKEPK